MRRFFTLFFLFSFNILAQTVRSPVVEENSHLTPSTAPYAGHVSVECEDGSIIDPTFIFASCPMIQEEVSEEAEDSNLVPRENGQTELKKNLKP